MELVTLIEEIFLSIIHLLVLLHYFRTFGYAVAPSVSAAGPCRLARRHRRLPAKLSVIVKTSRMCVIFGY